MKLNRIPTNAIAVIALALVLPMAALAGSNLSLDTGVSSGSGGDIGWSGTSMTPQGNATVFNIGGAAPPASPSTRKHSSPV